MPDGVSGSGSATSYVQFDKNIAHVPVDGTLTDCQYDCYFAVGLP